MKLIAIEPNDNSVYQVIVNQDDLVSLLMERFPESYNLCMEHNCPFFYVSKLDKNKQVISEVEG